MVALLIGSGCSVRQSPPATALEKLPDTAAMANPLAALTRMGGYLRTLKTFTVRAETTIDEVLADTGQKLQFGGRTTLYFRAPAHLRVDVSSERKDRQFFYDGKTLTVYGQRTRYYATVPAPPAIREVLEVAEQKYDLDFPLADLFYWGTDKADLEDIASSTYVGPSWVGGAACDHYAFRQQGVDWQIWIERGDAPLPRKLVITTTDDDTQPQYVAMLTWRLTPGLDDATFTFVAPRDARRIILRELGPAGGN
jgi:hypothetical protein